MNMMKEQLNVILMLLAVTQWVHMIVPACVLGYSGDGFNCTGQGHSMSNQHKIRPTPLDFDDTRTIVW